MSKKEERKPVFDDVEAFAPGDAIEVARDAGDTGAVDASSSKKKRS